ncbi:MAG: hypothetical protein ACTSU5_11520 [Promethearchaeota archaeon]
MKWDWNPTAKGIGKFALFWVIIGLVGLLARQFAWFQPWVYWLLILAGFGLAIFAAIFYIWYLQNA